MKRYLLFAGEKYYARPGMYDFISSFDTKEAAEKEIGMLLYQNFAGKHIEWCQIYDCVEKKVQMFGDFYPDERI